MAEFAWPLTWPVIDGNRFALKQRALFAASPLRGSRRVMSPLVEVWTCSFAMPSDRRWPEVDAFVANLDAGMHTVRMFDHMRRYPRGVAGGYNSSSPETWSDGTLWSDNTGWLSGAMAGAAHASAAAGAKALTISGLVASQARSFASGDLIEVGGYAYMIVGDTPSDASGRATVAIRPALRTAVVAGDVVKLAFATSPFQIIADDYAADRTMFGRGSVSLTMVELLPEA